MSSTHLITDRNRQKWSSLKFYQLCVTCYSHCLPKVNQFFGYSDPLEQLIIQFYDLLLSNWKSSLTWVTHDLQKYSNINQYRCNEFFRKETQTKVKRPFLTSVTAWIDAPCFRRSSITFILFFLHAMCRGVKPFCKWERTHFFGTLYILKGKPVYGSHTKHSSVITKLFPSLFWLQLNCLCKREKNLLKRKESDLTYTATFLYDIYCPF